MIYQILQELNIENGSNYKLEILKKHKDNSLLRRVFKLTKDGISFTYGISAQRWISSEAMMEAILTPREGTASLSDFLDHMEFNLAPRKITGNEALEKTHQLLLSLSSEDAYVAIFTLARDLKVNVGSTLAMKVWKDLIDKPNYMRCGVYGPKSKKDISFPAILQLKADGTYREAYVDSEGTVSFISRSGKTYEYPLLADQMKHFGKGYYTGELTVNGAENRSIGNGMINSDDVPHEKLRFDLWDHITEEEYGNAKRKVKNKTKYEDRLANLERILEANAATSTQIHLIETHHVASLEEAAAKCSEWMNNGFEGGVLKDRAGLYADGTSKYQLKMKVQMSVDVRIYGYQEGTPGTRREKTFGALLWVTDDDKVKGKTSGFTDAELEMFNTNRESWIGKIIEVEANDITKGVNATHYALSHPRFIEVRDDKTETDNLERIFELREMAFEFKA